MGLLHSPKLVSVNRALVQSSHFVDDTFEAQRRTVLCSRSHSVSRKGCSLPAHDGTQLPQTHPGDLGDTCGVCVFLDRSCSS